MAFSGHKLMARPLQQCLRSNQWTGALQQSLPRRFISNRSLLQQPGRSSSILQQIKHRRYASMMMSPSFEAASKQTYSREWWIRIGTTFGAVAGGTVLINWLLNRETRESLNAYERSYLNKTFMYVGGGLAIVAGTAIAMHKNGISLRVMRANPWAVMGVSLVGSIGFMYGTMNTDPRNTVQKHLCWAGFQAFQALTLSPLLFMNPALLARAALYTAGMMGSICYIGATAKSDQYLYLGGPLMAGLAVVALSSIAPLVLPAHFLGTLAVTQSLSMYGGLAVFGGFTLYDCQRMLRNASLARSGMIRPDPCRESIQFELNFINIFVRMVYLLGGNQRRK